jgi:hypothetical protein
LNRRSVGTGEDKEYVSAHQIMRDINAAKLEFANWEEIATSLNQFSNEASFNLADDVFSLLAPQEGVDYTQAPPEPAAYDGYTFQNTNTEGGYGSMTTG